jgi:hypothetical protein
VAAPTGLKGAPHRLGEQEARQAQAAAALQMAAAAGRADVAAVSGVPEAGAPGLAAARWAWAVAAPRLGARVQGALRLAPATALCAAG